ncbi:osmotically inducible protein OsmC [Aliifodinibius salipaludis]|uniref:Osmotically inducible protein OsmC n=1 Tax=Fodinibius salipaludis TaxID=2032627 RepID=A0A2A2G5W4_9BACT|nr:alpha/beta fold hydrolase [Aliifodinibius salipaludis]PAU93021.1 osmotically inducible protein OsmC [Aliifodinibius salipaludis]
MRSEKITFDGAFGDKLSARVDQPDGEARNYALFAHCFTCSKNLKVVSNLSKTLTKHGIGVLRFDFTGLGESEGDFADTNFSSNIEDLIAAADYMESHYRAPAILIGHSLGGAAVLQSASKIPKSKAVATIGAPADPEHVKENFGARLNEIEEKGIATVTLAGRDFTIKKQFIDDLEANNMDDKIRNLDRALMIFHSPVDQVVGIDNAANIYKKARHPKSFVSLDDANHLLTKQKDSFYLAEVLAAWANRYF